MNDYLKLFTKMAEKCIGLDYIEKKINTICVLNENFIFKTTGFEDIQKSILNI